MLDESYYPKIDINKYQKETKLKDGTKVLLRPMVAEDQEALYEFFKAVSKEEARALGELLERNSKKIGLPIYLISDEPYRRIVYDGIEVPSIFDAYRESFVVTSFSKDLSLPGERIGYVACNPEISDRKMIIAGMVLSNRILGYVNAPALIQRAVSVLLEESVDISLYQRKRDLLCDGLASCGFEFHKPGGAFYLFPKTPIDDDVPEPIFLDLGTEHVGPLEGNQVA